MSSVLLNKLLLNFSPSAHRLCIIFFMPLILSLSASNYYMESYVSANFLFIILSSGITFYLLNNNSKVMLNSFLILSMPGLVLSYYFIGLLGAFIFAYFHFYQIVKIYIFKSDKPVMFQIGVDVYYLVLLISSFIDILPKEIIIIMCAIPAFYLFDMRQLKLAEIGMQIKSIATYGATGFLTAAVPFLVINTLNRHVDGFYSIAFTQSAVFVSMFLLFIRYFSIEYLSSKESCKKEIHLYYLMRNKCIAFTLFSFILMPVYYLAVKEVYEYNFETREVVYFFIFYSACALSILSFPFSILTIKRNLESKNLRLNILFFCASVVLCTLYSKLGLFLFLIVYFSICLIRALVSLFMGNRNAHTEY